MRYLHHYNLLSSEDKRSKSNAYNIVHLCCHPLVIRWQTLWSSQNHIFKCLPVGLLCSLLSIQTIISASALLFLVVLLHTNFSVYTSAISKLIFLLQLCTVGETMRIKKIFCVCIFKIFWHFELTNSYFFHLQYLLIYYQQLSITRLEGIWGQHLQLIEII